MAGYKITPYTIRPFDEKELRNGTRADHQRRTTFNIKHAGARSIIERAFGRLKGRFPILKLMPGRHMPRVFHVIEALMILHNILLDLGDSPEDIDDFNPSDADADEVLEELLRRNGRALSNRTQNQPANAGPTQSIPGENAQTLRRGGHALREGIMQSLGI